MSRPQAAKIGQCGPLWTTAQWVMERINAIINALRRNPARVEESLIRGMADLATAMLTKVRECGCGGLGGSWARRHAQA